MSEEHDIKSSEEAARVSSEVTPNPKFKKIKEKISFLILLVCCVGLILWCLSPVKKNITSLNTSGDSASHDGTLAQNLELISQMEAQKTALQNKLNSLPRERIMQPPKLRSIQSNVDGNHETLSKELRARMNAPTSFAMDSASANSSEDNTGHHAILTGKDANSQFINQQNEVVSVSAKRLLHPDLTIPAGELIPAILEVAINSELPGMIRAVTTRDIYSLTGNNCLIPKGSTLTGQFNSGVVQGQSRLLAVWDRARMPDGIIVTLNSPSTDTLGRSGIDVDHINRHFFQRFGSRGYKSVERFFGIGF